MRQKNENGIFKFDADDIKRHIKYELNLIARIGNSFNFVHETLTRKGFNLDLKPTDEVDLDKDVIKWNEGKNYNWLGITCGNVKLLIRSYGSHFTIYSHFNKKKKFKDVEYSDDLYSAIMFSTNRDKITDDKLSDSYCDYPTKDLNDVLHSLIKMIEEEKVWKLWNNLSFKRPDHCDVDNIFHNEEIDSVDKLIFCAEELSSEHMGLFAENNMVVMLEELPEVIGFEQRLSDLNLNGIRKSR